MAGFTSYDQVISAITSGQFYQWDFFKYGVTAKAAGVMTRLWSSNGFPGAGREPPFQSAVTGATNATPIVITTATHSLTTGDTVNISGVGGNTAANGDWTIIVLSGTTFSLNTSVGNGAYTSGGTVNGTKYVSGAGTINFTDQASYNKHGLTFGGSATQDCVLVIWDRLVGVGGISIASTGNKTTNTPALPRYTDGIGVEAWLEISTAVSANTPVLTLNSYTNTAGTAAQTGAAVTLSATPTASAMYQFTVATGDVGIKSVETINVGTAGTNGVANLVLMKRLVEIPISANSFSERDLVLQLTSLPRIYDGASLCLGFMASTTTAPNVFGTIRLAYN